MKNTYNISYENLRIPCAKQIFDAIQRTLTKYDKKFFLIGALARDIIIEVIHERHIHRATMDIDIAVLLSNWHQYDEIYEKYSSLIQEPDFDYFKCGARVLGRKVKGITE